MRAWGSRHTDYNRHDHTKMQTHTRRSGFIANTSHEEKTHVFIVLTIAPISKTGVLLSYTATGLELGESFRSVRVIKLSEREVAVTAYRKTSHDVKIMFKKINYF